MPSRAYSNNPDVIYRWSGGRNRPGKIFTCRMCHRERWVSLDNIKWTDKCIDCYKSLRDITCPNCHKKFHPRNRYIRFCSRKCVSAFKHKKREMVCPNCDTSFYNRYNGKFCSFACWDDYRFTHASKNSGKSKENRITGRIQVTCQNCGAVFSATASANRKFCSWKCSGSAHKRYGPDNKWFIDGRSHNLKHYDRLMSPEWKALTKRIRKRDNYICRLCNREHMKLDVHHIIPHADGGPDEPHNLISLCRGCHTKAEKNPSLRESLLALLR